MAILNKTFRIFVSSTFSDLKEERNALQRDVFPKLRDLCIQHGFRFQAIDLRWGVREESALDQQAMNICLDEVARCQRPPNPNFVVLLGDRYGWQPLPAEIPSDEFTQIEKQLLIEEDKNLLKSWYKRDDNAVPAVYCIQPREVQAKADAPDSEKRRARDEESKLWEETETSLRRILRNALEKISFTDEDQRIKYESSATEQEIVAGALGVHDAKEHVFSFFREIEGLPQDESAQDNIDLIEEKGKKLPDTGAKGKLDALKEKLIEKTSKDNIFEYEAEWKGNGVSTQHIKKLCDDVYNRLSKIIEKEISLIEDKTPLEREIDAHEDFRKERAEVFVGRVEILNNIQGYIRKAEKHPLAVYGESGTGKSALMAYSLQQTLEEHSDAEVIFRFIGATPDSSNGRALLESLCRQISRAYGADESEIPSDYKELLEEFPKRLALATAEKTLIIYLDALDQLSDANNARNLNWLAADLPENVWLIVSTLPGECYEVLKAKIPGENLVKLRPMQSDEGEELLDLWLNDAKRALQVPQRKEILDHFNRTENGKPLYLKLAFEESRRWKSYTEKIKLSPDIRGVIQDLFKRLSSDENHGEMMVSRSLGYLAAAKNGLTEDELIDVLSEDEEVFNDFKQRSFHEPPERRLPVVIWSRLYFDIEPYLTERSADGASLMTFYHPTTFGESVKEVYLSGEDKKKRPQVLAEYFGNQSLYIEKDDKHTPNLRKLSELPFQQTFGNMWNELYHTLTDTEFLEQKNTQFIVYDLLEDYRTALEMMPQEDGVGKHYSVLHEFSKVLDQASFILKENPELTFSQLYNRLKWKAASNEMLEKRLIIAHDLYKKPWLCLQSRPAQSQELIRTFSGHTHFVNTCAFSPDGRRMISGSTDKTVRVWETETGLEIITLSQHSEAVNTCRFSPDGKLFASASDDNTIILWDAKTYEKRYVLKGHFSPDKKQIIVDGQSLKLWEQESTRTTTIGNQAGCDFAYSPDGSCVVIANTDELYIWDIEMGRKRGEMELHKGYDIICMALTCAYSPDGRHIASGMNEEIRLWDAETCQELSILKGHSDIVEDCEYCPDGKYIISASRDNTLKLWDSEPAQDIIDFQQHDGNVNSCSYSPDGKTFMSAGASNGNSEVLVLWDVASREIISTFKDFMWAGACVFSPNGKRMASASKNAFMIRDIVSKKEIIKFEGWIDYVNACTFSPDGKLIVSAGGVLDEGELILWDAKYGRKKKILKGHKAEVTDCDFSPDGRTVISVGGDKMLKFWDRISGKEILSLSGHRESISSCAYHPNGQYVITAGGFDHPNPDESFGELILWDINKRKGHNFLPAHEKIVRTCDISPDGRIAISGSDDETLKLWDTFTKEEIFTFKGFTSEIRTCTFSPDGTQIVLGDVRGQILLLELENFTNHPLIITPFKRLGSTLFSCLKCHSKGKIKGHSLGKEGICTHCQQSLKFNPFVISNL